ncbi:MAG: IS1380 family transposase [Bryobacterales bacterium]|nr:IS1380 family transposase [Bryobacterales bacterium]
MTECSQDSFDFEPHFSRQVTANFDGGTLTTDGGGLLLRKTERRIGLMKRLPDCFLDGRQARRVEHWLEEILAQRIYGLALGYEDLNDHEQLRHDPLLGVLSGKKNLQAPLAGKSTLNRLELTPEGDARQQRYHKIPYSPRAIDELLVSLFQEAHVRPPRRIVLDLDATDTPLHGHQESRFFHGYYNHYCYLPLYIFCGDHLLRARLRPANIDASAGSLEEVQTLVAQIRARWPKTRIILRADSGFCRDELMSWCEDNRVDYVFGFARNERLRKLIEPQMEQARAEHERTGQPARVFAEFDYETRDTWSRARRVVAKAERIEGKENPRFVVTSLGAQDFPAQALYEKLYCQRGEMENRIKEQLSLFADRLSTETMRANQLRLYFSSLAYVLVCALRRLALQGSPWAEAQVATIRLRLLKIAARVKVTARRIWVSYSSAYAWRNQFEAAFAALRR